MLDCSHFQSLFLLLEKYQNYGVVDINYYNYLILSLYENVVKCTFFCFRLAVVIFCSFLCQTQDHKPHQKSVRMSFWNYRLLNFICCYHRHSNSLIKVFYILLEFIYKSYYLHYRCINVEWLLIKQQSIFSLNSGRVWVSAIKYFCSTRYLATKNWIYKGCFMELVL